MKKDKKIIERINKYTDIINSALKDNDKMRSMIKDNKIIIMDNKVKKNRAISKLSDKRLLIKVGDKRRQDKYEEVHTILWQCLPKVTDRMAVSDIRNAYERVGISMQTVRKHIGNVVEICHGTEGWYWERLI
jgi:hypothetical protein